MADHQFADSVERIVVLCIAATLAAVYVVLGARGWGEPTPSVGLEAGVVASLAAVVGPQHAAAGAATAAAKAVAGIPEAPEAADGTQAAATNWAESDGSAESSESAEAPKAADC